MSNTMLLLDEANLPIEAYSCIDLNEYFVEVWKKAKADAYSEVMRCTTSPPGGKHKDESLENYVRRCREIQDKALAKYKAAKAELELYEGKITYYDSIQEENK